MATGNWTKMGGMGNTCCGQGPWNGAAGTKPHFIKCNLAQTF